MAALLVPCRGGRLRVDVPLELDAVHQVVNAIKAISSGRRRQVEKRETFTA